MARKANSTNIAGLLAFCLALALLVTGSPATAAPAEVSDATSECLDCHAEFNPGMVAAWQQSRHARTTPAGALKKPAIERRISATAVAPELAGTVVGCAECHTRNAARHPDAFEHNGYLVHTVVSPADCAGCHPQEAEQYQENLMAHAYGNLVHNPLYLDMAEQINAVPELTPQGGTTTEVAPLTAEDSCLSCHGTKVEIGALVSRDTPYGEMEFPRLRGWPNMGAGRVNPDGSKGSCSACHTRHQFSIAVARKPDTCSQCHKGPDVPAFKVYQVSKHGNIYSSQHQAWNFTSVPWTVGRDFTSPTCAACHMSALANRDGDLLVSRTHRLNDRLAHRIFGLIYAHPHPQEADTSKLRTKSGLPLPTDLDSSVAPGQLISPAEQQARRQAMNAACFGCHSGSWVAGYWRRLDHTIQTTNELTQVATAIIQQAWSQGMTRGRNHGDSLFDEPLERKWVEQWLFHANSIRFSSAMLGTDYGVFANGRWHLTKGIRQMAQELRHWQEKQASKK